MEECCYCLARLSSYNETSGVCDGCWYGSKLAPNQWFARLREIGRSPRVVANRVLPCDRELPAWNREGLG